MPPVASTRSRTKSCAIIAALGATSGLAVGIGADAAETHGTHEHGHAVLKLAQEGTDVVVHFESPLESIAGFEHAPANEEQRAALEEAMRLVAVPENILRLPAGCTSTGEPEVDIPHVAADHDAHDADEHSGADQDDHESGGHGGAGSHADEGDEVHSDLKATFNYRCESGPDWVEATAFAFFDGLEEVELQAVGADAVVAETLTAASPRAVLTGF